MAGIALTKLKALKRADLLITTAYVNGRWIEADDTIPVVDPATGEEIAHVTALETSVVDDAVRHASKAFVEWRNRLPLDRGSILRAWARGMRENADDLATIVTAEQGKPVKEAIGEIAYAAAFIDWFAAEGERAYGETIPSHLPGSRLSVQMQPIGVTAAITPWNFPSA
jgi:acyl-CoA reductase-like NAD-dependent aldehyde dehydrogenase